ncbi:MltA domain-containing protein [bacterium]|nr:MltA domain-containing protein [bacterium]
MLIHKGFFFLVMLSAVLFNSCTREFRPRYLPSDQVVSQYSTFEMRLVNRPYTEILLGDDLPVEGLRQAIENTLTYLDIIPQDQEFEYGKLKYTASEVAQSMRLFLEVLAGVANDRELVSELEKKFFIFESVANKDSQVMLTGYYEPVFKGSLQPSETYNVPVYGPPSDLNVLNLEQFRKSLKYRTIVYRMENGQLVPYHTREEIMEQNVLDEKAEILAWMQDPVDLFFLQIQGSGILILPSGDYIKLSWAGANGQPYSSIGKLLVTENKLLLEEVSMERIREYIKTHPEELKQILYHNKSYTFFNLEENMENPRGSLNVPLTPLRSIALDVTVFPKGSLGYLVSDVPEFDEKLEFKGVKPIARFVASQDTGGAIKGPGRVDLFWGNGPLAEKSAGMMRSFGKIYFIIAKKTVLDEITSVSRSD